VHAPALDGASMLKSAGEERRPFRVGGSSLVISGALFLLKAALDSVVGPPPSTGEQILAWMASGKIALAFINEATFIAALLLIPGMLAVHASLASTKTSAPAVGAGLFAMALPILSFSAIIQGRLVYDLFGIHIGEPASAKLIIAVYYGGLHAAGIILAVATLVLSLAMRDGAYGRKIANLGFATSAFDLIGSYPWVVGAPLVAASQVLFASWLIAVGAKLYTLEPATKTTALDQGIPQPPKP